MPKRVTVAKLADLPPGQCLSVEAKDIGIALCNVGGTIYALDNICAHAGGPLGEGFLDGDCVECPWHGWRYNQNGRAAGKPSNQSRLLHGAHRRRFDPGGDSLAAAFPSLPRQWLD